MENVAMEATTFPIAALSFESNPEVFDENIPAMSRTPKIR
jgi:hypothetical protein